MTKKKIEFVLMVACAITTIGCAKKQQEQHVATYAAVTVAPTSVTLSESYTASIQGRQDIAIFPQVAGTISEVKVKEGQRVKKGQSLFTIDQVPFKAALQMADANVEAAQAGVATAQLVYDSRVQLYAQEVISEFDLQTSKNQLLSAKAGLAQAQAAQVTARNNMTYTRVESPADGVVGTLPFREGALVSPQTPVPLTTVSDNSQMYVYFSMSENQLLALTAQHGTMDEVLASLPSVKLQLNNGTLYEKVGKIETISGVIDPNTGSVSVRAVFPNEGGLLHSGASGKVILERSYDNRILLPCTATYEMQDLVFAYRVVDGKTVATQLQVQLTDDATHYVVNSGLTAGDVVVTEGVGMLRDGQEIAIKTEE